MCGKKPNLSPMYEKKRFKFVYNTLKKKLVYVIKIA